MERGFAERIKMFQIIITQVLFSTNTQVTCSRKDITIARWFHGKTFKNELLKMNFQNVSEHSVRDPIR